MSIKRIGGMIKRNLREVRFHYSPTAEASYGLRNFIQTNYKELRRAVGSVPLMMRAASAAPCQIFLVNLKDGKEEWIGPLENLSAERILEQVSDRLDLLDRQNSATRLMSSSTDSKTSL